MKRITIIVSILLSMLLFSGCAFFTLYMDFGRRGSFRSNDVLTLQSPRPDILEVVAEVVESMGYRVSSLDGNEGHIEMYKTESFLRSFFTGKGSSTTLGITSMDGGKKLNIELMVSGKRGAGQRENGMLILADFKQKLQQRL